MFSEHPPGYTKCAIDTRDLESAFQMHKPLFFCNFFSSKFGIHKK